MQQYLQNKKGLVQNVFDQVYNKYDLMNDFMSLGIHRLWKASLIDQLRPRPGMHLLDVAGGTGDIAVRFCDAGGGKVTVCDINRSMVEVGRDRATGQDKGLRARRRRAHRPRAMLQMRRRVPTFGFPLPRHDLPLLLHR